MSEFHFVAARITAAQICRSAGIERSSASVLDALTSIMLDFLTMLGTAATSATEARGADQADISDALLAAVQCGVVHGPLMGDMFSQRDIDELMQWIGGPIQQRMSELARPQRALNAQYSVNPMPNVPNAPTNSGDTAFNIMTGVDGTNQSIPAPPLLTDSNNGNETVAADLPTNSEDLAASAPQELLGPASNDWLRAVICRQSAMGHKDFNESLASSREPDFMIHGL